MFWRQHESWYTKQCQGHLDALLLRGYICQRSKPKDALYVNSPHWHCHNMIHVNTTVSRTCITVCWQGRLKGRMEGPKYILLIGIIYNKFWHDERNKLYLFHIVDTNIYKFSLYNANCIKIRELSTQLGFSFSLYTSFIKLWN